MRQSPLPQLPELHENAAAWSVANCSKVRAGVRFADIDARLTARRRATGAEEVDCRSQRVAATTKLSERAPAGTVAVVEMTVGGP
jgi:hypothetical protein